MSTDLFATIHHGHKQPEISFLMPVYQQARYIKTALHSVLRQCDVVTEIIVSDDASSDGTLDIAQQTIFEWLAQHDCPHRVLIRRGSTRLWRDHLPLLVDAATCDVVCQAHGDDISHSMRGKFLVYIFNHFPRITLAASKSIPIDENDFNILNEQQIQTSFELKKLSDEQLIVGHQDVVGFSQAWRRSALSAFPRLDRQRAAVAHDRILPFRAGLVGDCCLIEEPLVKRRNHSLAARHLMFDEPESNGQFGWNLTRLVHAYSMHEDLMHAWKTNLINIQTRDDLMHRINNLMSKSSIKMIQAYKNQMQAGRQIAWVDDATLLEIKKRRIAP